MIPNCIHFIFFGFTQFEYIHYLAVKSAHTVHRPDHIYLYYTTKPKNNPLWDEIESLVTLVRVDPPEEFNGVPLDSFQYKADVLRLQLLIEHGGIYLDIDAVSLKPFNDLVNHSCVLGIESGGDTLDTAESISNAVILAEPNHPFIVDWLEQTGQNLKDQHWAYHAVNLPVEMLKSKDYAVHLEPRKSFMPFGWRDQWVWEPGNQAQLADSYTMHLWETIWKDQLSQVTKDYLIYSDSTFATVLRNHMNPLKIAIYTICKNEKDFVDRWAASNSEADYRLVCDTGSADNTVELLKSQGVDVIPIGVDPWRFDVARNTALNLLPQDIDICIWQDLDEELLPGWRNSIERNWVAGTTVANHKYRHNNGAWQWHSKIHARHGCWWIGAVHEELRWNCEESAIWLQDFFLDEHQDVGKSRTSYLDLLLKKINEGDDNWRTYSFLAVEYQRVNDLINTVKYRKISYDAYTESDAVKSYLARVLGNAHNLAGDAAAAEKWFKIATEHGRERESWFALAEHYYHQKQWDLCYIAAKTCLTIDQRCDGFTFDPRAWDSLAYDYAALSAYHLGITAQAVAYGKQAVALNPTDQRLINNLKLYEQS
jgi:tetratricopeptide (TPR) repeat protein